MTGKATRRLRVLHVIPSVGPARGGPSFAVANMARGLAAAGHDVHVATTDDDGAAHRLSVPLGVPVPTDGSTYWYFPRQTSFYLASWPMTRWLAANVASFDVLHIHALFSYATLPAATLARWHGVPYVVRPLGTLSRWSMAHRRRLLKRASFQLLERKVLAHAALVHFTSEQERLEADDLGVRLRSAVIPLGIDLSPFADLPPAQQFCDRYPHLADRTRILFLSRIDQKKGIDLLLPALAALRTRHPRVALLLAGSGDDALMAQIGRDAERLGVQDLVFPLGFLAGTDKLAAFAAADVYVLPSYSENFGNSVVEALAAGVPAVVSDQVGIHREIDEAGAGTVVPCHSAPLAAALDRLLADSAARQEMGRRGCVLARERFSMAAMTAALAGAYGSLARAS